MNPVGEIIEESGEENRGVITELESKRLVGSVGIATTQIEPATSEQEALAFGRVIGYPCVLEISSPDIIHKDDVGYPPDLLSQALDVNVSEVFPTMKYAIPHTVHGGGASVVTKSAVGAVLGVSEAVAYPAGKHALAGIMKLAARGPTSFNIRVNTVNPRLFKNPMGESVISQASIEGRVDDGGGLLERNLLKRCCLPEEVAELMLCLTSDASGFCTAAMYFIDGGMQYS